MTNPSPTPGQSAASRLASRAVRASSASLGTLLLAAMRIGGSLAITKGTAIVGGPAGVALLGAFQNFTAVALGLCSGGLNTGIVKTVAETTDGEGRTHLVRQVLALTAICTACIVVSVLAFAGVVADRILSDAGYWWIVALFALLAPGMAFNTAILHILVGLGRQKQFLHLNLLAAGATVVLALPLAYALGVPGALLVASIANALVLAVSYPMLRAAGCDIRPFSLALDREVLRRLAPFPLMALASAVLVPAGLIAVRNLIVENSGVDAAGHWQGVVKVSEAYMLVVAYSILMFLLPRLATRTGADAKRTVLLGTAGSMALALVLSAPIYLGRELVVKLLFTQEFRPMIALFGLQILGDFLRSAVLALQSVLAARAALLTYLGVEIVFVSTYVLAANWLVPESGPRGAMLAWLIASATAAVLAITLVMARLRAGSPGAGT